MEYYQGGVRAQIQRMQGRAAWESLSQSQAQRVSSRMYAYSLYGMIVQLLVSTPSLGSQYVDWACHAGVGMQEECLIFTIRSSKTCLSTGTKPNQCQLICLAFNLLAVATHFKATRMLGM